MDSRFLSKTVSGMLASVMLFSAASCGNSSDSVMTQTGSSAAADNDVIQSSGTEDTEKEEKESIFPDIKYDGSDIMFLTEETSNGYECYSCIEIYSESIDGTLINDTVYNRNTVIEEQFNVKIAQDRLPGAASAANKEILAGDDKYDVVMPYMNSSVSNASQGLYVDLNTVDNLHLENRWWDRKANEYLRVNENLFFTTGDISILDNECTLVMFFNKQMVTDFGFENQYDLVRNGEWTIDKLFEECFIVTGDINGDGKYSLADDRFGFFCAGGAPEAIFFGTGERITDYNACGNIKIVMYNERSADTVDKVLTYCLDDRTLKNAVFKDTCPLFLESRLFCAGWTLTCVSYLREAEFDFGILPFPKYDEEQNDYFCLISTGLVPGVSIPVTNKDTAKAGLILEALAYYSAYTLTPAYYDVTLTNKYFRDTESGEMLDIIFESRVYDLGYIYDIGGLGSLISTLFNIKTNRFTSMYEANVKKALAQVEEIETTFEESTKTVQ